MKCLQLELRLLIYASVFVANVYIQAKFHRW
jgi:hypothetical protein